MTRIATPQDRQSGKAASAGPDKQAAEWVIRLADPALPPDQRRVFRDWLAADPRHAQAYDFARATWGQMGAMQLEPHLAAPTRAPRWTMLAAACIAALAFGGARFWFGDALLVLRADHVAGHALRIIDLPDGSRAELAPGSAIDVDFSPARRHITLLQGQAYFTARPAPDAGNRPFQVQADDVTVTALGTEFAVAKREGQPISVTVAEHSVRVTAGADDAAAHQAVVEQGHGLQIGPDDRLSPVTKVETDLDTAWRQDRLIFDDQPLARVVQELNRYERRQIVIRSSAVANRRVSGVFDASDVDNAVARIAEALDLRQMTLPPFVTLLY